MLCSVFPKPMSSHNAQFRLYCPRLAIHVIPCLWYSLSVTPAFRGISNLYCYYCYCYEGLLFRKTCRKLSPLADLAVSVGVFSSSSYC